MFKEEEFGEFGVVARRILMSAPFESRGGRPITNNGKRVFICTLCNWWGLSFQVYKLSDSTVQCSKCLFFETLLEEDLLEFLYVNRESFSTLLNYSSQSSYWASEEWRKKRKELYHEDGSWKASSHVSKVR